MIKQLSGQGGARLVPNTVLHGKCQLPSLTGKLQVLRRVQLSDGSWLDELVPMVVPLKCLIFRHCLCGTLLLSLSE